MFTTICLGLILAVGLVTLLISLRADDTYYRSRGIAIAGFAFALFVLLGFLSCFNLVKAAEVGVPVAFGKVGSPIESGVHFLPPWTTVETFPIRPLNVDVEQKVRTADAGAVTIKATARWAVDTKGAKELYFQARTGDEEKIGKDVISRNMSQAIGDVYNGISNVDSTSRKGRAEVIQTRLAQLVAPYGVKISAVQLRDIEPDATTAQSIADYAAQQRKTKIAEEANLTAVAEAKTRVSESNGYAKAANALKNISATEAQLLCVQEWAKATAQGRNIYSQPCGGASALVTTNK